MKVESNFSSMSLMPVFNAFPFRTSIDTTNKNLSKDADRSQVKNVTDNLNKMLQKAGTHIQVEVHDNTNTIMVRVVNDETKEVIREIPSEKLLDMMYDMWVRAGLFMDEKI